jgi:hypothetical protein
MKTHAQALQKIFWISFYFSLADQDEDEFFLTLSLVITYPIPTYIL